MARACCQLHLLYLSHKVADHVPKLCLEDRQNAKVLAEPHGPEGVPHMRRDIPQKLQPSTLLCVRARLSGGVDHPPDANLDNGEGGEGVDHQRPWSMTHMRFSSSSLQ